MKARSFHRALIILLRVLSIVGLLLTIPVVVLISLFLPWRGIISLLFFILPWSLLVLWAGRLIWLGRLSRKRSPVAFYAVSTAGLLFWLVFTGIGPGFFGKTTSPYLEVMTPRRLTALTTGVLNDAVDIASQERWGLFLKRDQRCQLLRDYARFYAGVLFPFLANPNDIRILDYHVRSYDFFEAGVLFQDIFIEQSYFFRAAERPPRIIDCGSHIGLSILYFKALYPGAEVLGFEPAPETFKLLRENVKRNRLERVSLENKAVSNVDGKMAFYGDKSVKSSLLPERGQETTIEVDVVRLSRYIDRNVSLLKLDVEGVEDLVLEDLAASGKLAMIEQAAIEYHHHISWDVGRLPRFLKILEDHHFGYEIRARRDPAHGPTGFEDIMIYAYRK